MEFLQTFLKFHSHFNIKENSFSAIPGQKKFYFDAISHFFTNWSIHYWCFNFVKIVGGNIYSIWLQALDYAYGHWLNQEKAQQWIGCYLTAALKK